MEKTTKKSAATVEVAKKVARKSSGEKVAKKEASPKRQVKKVSSRAPKKGAPLAQGIGRRKQSVARVWVRSGKGDMIINEREFNQYFDTDATRKSAKMPFGTIREAEGYDVTVNVKGGGLRGQADAVKLGFARALLSLNDAWRPLLRKAGLLTVDSRQKERKKYGQRGARRKFQFVKR